jgi:four helix bundle protein
MRRSAVSIPSNISEGFERDGRDEFIQFLSMAKGSAGELRTQLYLAMDEGFVSESDARKCLSLSTEVSKLINGLIEYLKGTDYSGRKYNN